jgi:vacuolar iron transporter family protein
MNKETADHFKGKAPLEHLIEARIRGAAAVEETHGVELPGHLFAAFDAAKETALIGLVFLTMLAHFLNPKELLLFFGAFSIVFLIWKFGRSSLLGWTRLERLHRLIEEERWEIEHHRPQERIELKAMYQAKGFSGKLLDEVTDVLMADDNRLLQVMLQEELGLPLEKFEHPLKQGIGALLGVFVTSALLIAGFFLHPFYGPIAATFLVVMGSAALSAKKEKNRIMNFVVWNASLTLLVFLISIFIMDLLISHENFFSLPIR